MKSQIDTLGATQTRRMPLVLPCVHPKNTYRGVYVKYVPNIRELKNLRVARGINDSIVSGDDGFEQIFIIGSEVEAKDAYVRACNIKIELNR